MSEASDTSDTKEPEEAGETAAPEGEASEDMPPPGPADRTLPDAPASKRGAALRKRDDAAPDRDAAAPDRDEDPNGDDVAAPAAPAPKIDHPSFVFLGIVTAVTLAADLGTKIWAEKRFSGAERRMSVWGEHVFFALAKNKGGAWGLLSGEKPALRIGFFIAISIIAVVFILSLYRKTAREQKALTWGLPLVLGGALGNLVDRIRYGEVVDFIEVHLGSYQYPTFNVADIVICVGVGLMAIDMFTPRRRRRGAKTAADAKPADKDAESDAKVPG